MINQKTTKIFGLLILIITISLGGLVSSQSFENQKLTNVIKIDPPFEKKEITITWPPIHQTFQRTNETSGTIVIKGISNGMSGNFSYSYVETHNNSITGNGFGTSDNTPNVFETNFTLPIGAYNLTIYDTENPSLNATVDNIRIGDIYWITGQSNAKLSTNHQQTFTGPYNLYEFKGGWVERINQQVGWINIFNNLSTSNNIPIAYYKGAHNGVGIEYWIEGGREWNESVSNYTAMFDGLKLPIATTLMFQGESETYSNDIEYINKENYILYANQTINYFPMYSPGVIMGQINQVGTSDERLILARRPQQQLWSEQTNIHRGPSTYDIKLSANHVHFRTFDEHKILAERWINCINSQMYFGTGCTKTSISAINVIEPNKFRVTFNNPVHIAGWNKTSFENAKGFRLTKEGENQINDSSGIVSTSLINDTLAEVLLAQPIQGIWTINYGRSNDANPETYGEEIEIGTFRDYEGRPIEILWDYELNFTV